MVLAADDTGVVAESAAGPRATAGDEPVTPDDVFRIASMTKPATTAAALRLWERGELDLAAPVSAYLPAYGELPVLEAFDGDEPRLRPSAAPGTVHQLLTHTSGHGYMFWDADVLRWQRVTGTPDITTGRLAAFSTPLVADPGTRFEYGISTDWLGRVVEAVGGAPLDVCLAREVLEPLGMADTGFAPTAAQRARLVPLHRRRGDAPWTATEIDWPQEPEFWSGGHGLYSTPRDYLVFQRMLLGGGALGDVRLLRADTVAAAFADQLGGLSVPPLVRTAHPPSSCDWAPGPGHTWGHGLLVNTVDQPGRRAAGSGGWAGIQNTHFWVDPARRLTGALYTQCLPFLTPAVVQLYEDVERALYAGR
ncbi:MAG: beta-lactamase family protein [Actinomycetota bacterium]|nr:beta-lactamase family protein [Actinomycetota bacterium]